MPRNLDQITCDIRTIIEKFNEDIRLELRIFESPAPSFDETHRTLSVNPNNANAFARIALAPHPPSS